MQLDFPRPAEWTGLENLTAMLVENEYGSLNVQRLGRQGQRQDGVDVLASTWGPHGDLQFGYQCKAVQSLTLTQVEAECALAKNFKPTIDRYIIVTTIPRDAKLQSSVRGIDSKTYGFPVDIWFWDDLNEKINRAAEVAQAYFSKITLEAQPAAASAHAGSLHRALDRAAFLDSIHYERSVKELLVALVRTRAFMRTGYLHDNLKNFVESTVPPHKIGDKRYTTFCSTFINKLDQLYYFVQANMDELKDTGTNSGAAAAAKFTNLRAELLVLANKEFVRHQLDELPIQV
ncbi:MULTISPECIES: hypothetical protein [unclassified Arthrobacter]|uniref:hypothetical protein n=1 Tax=unclassified Arthrobacter TaxID=235627 RepID=UPI0028833248|nr:MULTISPECIES: hypothetical protein [unclassified Arthrobacter]